MFSAKFSGAPAESSHSNNSIITEGTTSAPNLEYFDDSNASETTKNRDNSSNNCKYGEEKRFEYRSSQKDLSFLQEDILRIIFDFLSPKDLRIAAQFVLFPTHPT